MGRGGQRRPDGVYPRACGGTASNLDISGQGHGLSPRLRGNHFPEPVLDSLLGSIPAPAGEPPRGPARRLGRPVYPRACGGTLWWSSCPCWRCGLSPRLRGNRAGTSGPRGRGGSIPAPAGEPKAPAGRAPLFAVYPRACGGTRASKAGKQKRNGLSPRLRGNPVRPRPVFVSLRSIPAPAGEPAAARHLSHRPPVYPRACGGTLLLALPVVLLSGLSPRLRGNRGVRFGRYARTRSIPAPAGEPYRCAAPGTPDGVYPRACGGTRSWGGRQPPRWGLSPRLRGNRGLRPGRYSEPGSIPAPAGEPVGDFQGCDVLEVYPRACGGTTSFQGLGRIIYGLSPRLRGNRDGLTLNGPLIGSIPAPAGEPAKAFRRSEPTSVYPRACGGTFSFHCLNIVSEGLSPRLRGNLQLQIQFRVNLRSIPAPAGEP